MLRFASSVCLTSKIKIFRSSGNIAEIRIDLKIYWALRWAYSLWRSSLSSTVFFLSKKLVQYTGYNPQKKLPYFHWRTIEYL